VATQYIGSDKVEQDPEEIVQSLISAAENALSSVSDEVLSSVTHCTLVTQRSSLVVCRNDNGQALSPIISWRDTRGGQWFDQPARVLKLDAIKDLSGLVPNPHYGATKIKWLIDNDPTIGKEYRSDNLLVLPLAAFLVRELTRESNRYVDPANASRTLLMNVTRRCWDDELLGIFDLGKIKLPAIVNTDHHFGTFHIKEKSLRLSIVNGDQSAAVFAQGIPASNIIYANMGTGAFIYTPISELHTQGRLLKSIVFSNDKTQQYMLEGTVNGAGAALDFQSKTLGVVDYVSLLEKGLLANHCNTVFINSVGGLGSPDWQQNVPSYFLDEQQSDDDKLVAVAESIIFLLIRNLEHMRKTSDEVEAIHISGGLSRFDSMCQRLADLSQLPVLRHEDHEATARGAAFLFFRSMEWSVDSAQVFEPVSNDALLGRYQRWQQEMNQVLSA